MVSSTRVTGTINWTISWLMRAEVCMTTCMTTVIGQYYRQWLAISSLSPLSLPTFSWGIWGNTVSSVIGSVKKLAQHSPLPLNLSTGLRGSLRSLDEVCEQIQCEAMNLTSAADNEDISYVEWSPVGEWPPYHLPPLLIFPFPFISLHDTLSLCMVTG